MADEFLELDDVRIAGFLEELAALTRKHGIKIHGCGCCGSPSLYGIAIGDFTKPGHYEIDGTNDLVWREHGYEPPNYEAADTDDPEGTDG